MLQIITLRNKGSKSFEATEEVTDDAMVNQLKPIVKCNGRMGGPGCRVKPVI